MGTDMHVSYMIIHPSLACGFVATYVTLDNVPAMSVVHMAIVFNLGPRLGGSLHQDWLVGGRRVGWQPGPGSTQGHWAHRLGYSRGLHRRGSGKLKEGLGTL